MPRRARAAGLLLALGAAAGRAAAAEPAGGEGSCEAGAGGGGPGGCAGGAAAPPEEEDTELAAINGELVAWLRSGGGFVHACVHARRCPPHGGRCLATSCSLAAGERLISVPPRLQLRPYDTLEEASEACPAREGLEGIAAQLRAARRWNLKQADVFLAARLLAEQALGDASSFLPYLRSLPTEYPGILQDQGEQHRCLEGTPGATLIPRRFDRERAKVAALRPCAAGASEARARLARLAVDTRAFSGTVAAGASKGQEWEMLVPFADILNDAVAPSASWGLEEGSGEFVVRATSAVPAGREVFITYGPKANDKLLSKYGFVLADNPHDTAIVYLREPDASMRSAPPALSLSLDPEAYRELPTALAPLARLRAGLSEGGEAAGDREVLSHLRRRCLEASRAWGGAPNVSEGSRWMCDGLRAGLASIREACLWFADAGLAALEGGPPPPPAAAGAGTGALGPRLGAELLAAWREHHAAE